MSQPLARPSLALALDRRAWRASLAWAGRGNTDQGIYGRTGHPPQLGQKPRRLQEKGRRRPTVQSAHRSRSLDEKKVRRLLMRARNRPGFGWKRRSTVRLPEALGLLHDDRVRYGART